VRPIRLVGADAAQVPGGRGQGEMAPAADRVASRRRRSDRDGGVDHVDGHAVTWRPAECPQQAPGRQPAGPVQPRHVQQHSVRVGGQVPGGQRRQDSRRWDGPGEWRRHQHADQPLLAPTPLAAHGTSTIVNADHGGPDRRGSAGGRPAWRIGGRGGAHRLRSSALPSQSHTPVVEFPRTGVGGPTHPAGQRFRPPETTLRLA
jgi:hypothetical protein